MKQFFTLEETAALAELNLLDLMEMVESGKVKPSSPLELLIVGAPVNLILPPGTIVERPEPPLLFTRSKIREIQHLKNGKSNKNQSQTNRNRQVEKLWNPAADPHSIYTPVELAQAWGLSVATIRRLCEKEDGVMKHGEQNPGTEKKRRYVTLRIPHAVAVRVYRKLSSC